ncbi:MAG: glycosyltransferase [Lachnospiraceae bacterium]|nr:glycosyltransferase [Lachnospiraceae bacterium]
MTPTFSIIVPVYQVEQYLDKCVESILRQSYQDFEVILVDDGSKDTSGELCDSYAKKNTRFQVIHKENGGLSDARNAGLEVARGKYIYFLDSDDFIEEDLLQKTLCALQETQADMVAFGYKRINGQGETVEEVRPEERSYTLKTQEEKYDYFVHVLLQYGQCWEAWNRIYKGDIIREHQLRFVDNDRIFAEDLLFLLMYLMHARSIAGIGDLFYSYLIRESSIMDRKSKKCNTKQITELAKCFYAYLERENFHGCCMENYQVILGILLFNEGRNKAEEAIEAGLAPIREDPFVFANIKKLYRRAGYLRKTFSAEYTAVLLGFLGKIYGDSWEYRPGLFVRAYRKLIVRGLLPYIAYWRHSRNIFLIGSEDAGNLGDHQIAVSVREFLTSYFPRYRVIEVAASNYRKELQEMKRYIRKRDWICTPGGGNLGDVYPYSEEIRREVISDFPKNKIIIFPQTVYFSDTPEGAREKQRTKEIYCGHKKLLLTVREKTSLQRAKEIFDGRIELVPDIVLFSDKRQPQSVRRGALFCLRSDLEGRLSEGDRQQIEAAAVTCNLEYQYMDHQLAFDIPIRERDRYLKEIMQRYKTTRLIVTDRLHGMVFAAVTGTPCIVLDNYNQKVSGVYEWIEDLPYIAFCNKIEKVGQIMEKLLEEVPGDEEYPRKLLQPEFDRLAGLIANKRRK